MSLSEFRPKPVISISKMFNYIMFKVNAFSYFCSRNILFSDNYQPDLIALQALGIQRKKTQKMVNLQGYVSSFQRT